MAWARVGQAEPLRGPLRPAEPRGDAPVLPPRAARAAGQARGRGPRRGRAAAGVPQLTCLVCGVSGGASSRQQILLVL